MHEAPATMRFREGQIYAALRSHVGRLFPCFELVIPRLLWGNLTMVPGHAASWF